MQGLALVIVLWILTLLTLIASSFAITMRRETSISTALTLGARAQALAETGLTNALYRLTLPQAELRWRPDGRIYVLPLPDGEIRASILSEAGKVDINAGTTDQLRAVLQLAVESNRHIDDLVEAILDWRDADNDARSGGSEERAYRLARLPYGPRNEAFQSLEELQRVVGMTPAIFQRIRPFITVYSGNDSVDIQLADPVLIDAIRREMRQRGIDDAAFDADADNRLESSDEQNGVDASFDNENQVYTIKVHVGLNDADAGLEAVVRVEGGEGDSPFSIMDWRQNPEGPSLFDPQQDGRVVIIDDEFKYNHRL